MKVKGIVLGFMMMTTTVVGLQLHAESSVTKVAFKERVKNLVEQHYTKKMLNEFFLNAEAETLFHIKPNHNCQPQPISCVGAACKYLDKHECDDLSEIKEITTACRGNYNGECLQALCENLDSHECDDIFEIEQLAPACIGNIDGSCVREICSNLDSHECDDINEVTEVARLCGGLE